MDITLTYHGATHLNSGSNGPCEVITGTFLLEAKGGIVDKLFVIAQAGGIVGIA